MANTARLRICTNSTRVRKSPYYERTVEGGCQSFTVYNHMLLPASYGRDDRDYWSLREACVMWDVAAQRQLRVSGRDSSALLDYLCTRRMSTMGVNTCRYALICNFNGVVLNDPLVLRHGRDEYWLSVGDSDVGMWVDAVARMRKMEASVTELDAAPLAVQGPQSTEVVSNLMGSYHPRDMKFFDMYRGVTICGNIPVVVSRSGWSPDEGYEIYLLDSSRGSDLWREVERASDHHLRAAAPNQPRRIEGGMISVGADTVRGVTTATETNLAPKFTGSAHDGDFVGKEALLRRSPKHLLKRFALRSMPRGAPDSSSRYRRVHEYHEEALGHTWNGDRTCFVTDARGMIVGCVTSIAWSPGRKEFVGFALMSEESRPPVLPLRALRLDCRLLDA